MNGPGPERPIEERPPLFGSWPRWYAVVLAELALVILVAIVLTRVYG